MIKAVFFDLFFTLITPEYAEKDNEYSILGITKEEWEHYAEDSELYYERALGTVSDEREIIERIVAKLPFAVSNEKIDQLLRLREERMKRALLSVPADILNTLSELKAKGIKIGLISNADLIDQKYWNSSVLNPFFDDAVFSCDVGLLKPDPEIFKLALNRMGVLPEESIFVGDGGSNELAGAKSVGMRTIFSEVLEQKDCEKKEQIMKSADRWITNFGDIIEYIHTSGENRR